MTFTGIVRGVDRLGRIVLPRKLRLALGLKELTDPIEIYVSDGGIILKKSKGNTDIAGDLRCLDNFGRIVIPNEIRTLLGIVPKKDSLEIYCEGDNIILKKFYPGCIFCDSPEKLITYKGKKVCAACIKELCR